MSTLLLSKNEVNQLLTMELAIASAKEAYKMYYYKQIEQPPIVSIDIKQHNGELDVKSCYSLANETISVKIASGYWDNPKSNLLPTMIANISIFDGKSGYPLCIMDGSLITGYRTGAAGGLSASLLANKTSQSIGVIGTGTQARMQVLAVKKELDIKDVYVFSVNQSAMVQYKKDIESQSDIRVHICKTPKEAIYQRDIVITTTPSTRPIVRKDWINKGMHIIAVGADMAGKQELDSDIFKEAKIFVDSKNQCLERGETRNPIIENVILESDIQSELAAVLLGFNEGRISDEDITIFDTTGMGVQDNVLAFMIYQKALELKMGIEFNFLNEKFN